MIFSDLVKAEFPKRPIRVRVGDTESYMGVHCEGLAEMKPEQIKWLDSHAPIHKWYSAKEIELVYRKSKQYEQIVWGDNEF